jgi:hypothetical protein
MRPCCNLLHLRRRAVCHLRSRRGRGIRDLVGDGRRVGGHRVPDRLRVGADLVHRGRGRFRHLMLNRRHRSRAPVAHRRRFRIRQLVKGGRSARADLLDLGGSTVRGAASGRQLDRPSSRTERAANTTRAVAGGEGLSRQDQRSPSSSPIAASHRLQRRGPRFKSRCDAHGGIDGCSDNT